LSVLRTSLYPLRVDRVREADIARWIAACETAGVIALYEHGGKPYLQMLDTRWTARSEPKFPLPTDGGSMPMRPAENTCKQVNATVPVFGVVVVVEDVASPPPSGVGLFEEFWKAYPKKKAKDDALKAFTKRKPTRVLLDAMLRAIQEQSRSADWLKDRGQFIPYPATWLNAARWQDSDVVEMVAPPSADYERNQAMLKAEASRVIEIDPERLARAREVSASFKAAKAGA
jgi:hypothetical protein